MTVWNKLRQWLGWPSEDKKDDLDLLLEETTAARHEVFHAVDAKGKLQLPDSSKAYEEPGAPSVEQLEALHSRIEAATRRLRASAEIWQREWLMKAPPSLFRNVEKMEELNGRCYEIASFHLEELERHIRIAKRTSQKPPAP